MARQSATLHLGVLKAVSLITTVRQDREKLHYLNPSRYGPSRNTGWASSTAPHARAERHLHGTGGAEPTKWSWSSSRVCDPRDICGEDRQKRYRGHSRERETGGV